MPRTLTIAFAALPFVFGAIRAVKTGTDARYLWVALAAGIGAFTVAQLTQTTQTAGSLPVVAVFAFVASTAAGIAAAMMLGTRLGPGILIVAASFAGCFAAACVTAAHPGRR